MRGWTPTFGAHLDATGARVRVCSPGASGVRVLVGDLPPVLLDWAGDDVFEGHVEDARAGDRYRLQVDNHTPWPDPCARWQPDGVHGPSMLIDPAAFTWTDQAWRGVPRHELVIYELHVGTFTTEGTFRAAITKLPALVDLGVTAIELMPVAAFPGTRNWGYDGAALFAPSEHYGHPDDLRALVDRAHALGLAVLLDVVYNHLGPDGAYLAACMPTIFSDRHTTPWGRAINLDGAGSHHVRRLLCDNALHWLLEYHMDGLRLDATHALADEGPLHFLAQLAREVDAAVPGRHVHLIAEDERNLDTLLLAHEHGGHGLTGVWADDFHHAVRRHLAGDHEAWFADFTGTSTEIAQAVRDGWVFTGQHAEHYGGPRGTSPEEVAIEAPVICLQNHDQVGNRAHGERLHHQIGEAAWLAATTLLLTAPETPMLFMGQEWAASTPFLFFTDHAPDLGARVVEGRRSEFVHFAAFADLVTRERIPSPQDVETWRRSQLRWAERDDARHARVLAETTALIGIRRRHLATPRDRQAVRCEALDDRALWLVQPSARGGHLATLVDFSGQRAHRIPTRADAIDVLHATRPGSSPPVVKDVRVDSDAVVVETTGGPFGLVLHLLEESR